MSHHSNQHMMNSYQNELFLILTQNLLDLLQQPMAYAHLNQGPQMWRIAYLNLLRHTTFQQTQQ